MGNYFFAVLRTSVKAEVAAKAKQLLENFVPRLNISLYSVTKLVCSNAWLDNFYFDELAIS